MSIVETVKQREPLGRWGRTFARSRFARHVAVLAGSTVLAQAMGLAVAPLLTRLYLPEHFGALAAFSALASTFSVVVVWRYEQAIPLARNNAAAVNVAVLCLGLTLAMSLVAGILVVVAGSAFGRVFDLGGAAGFLWLLPLSLLGSGWYLSLSSWAARQKAFPRVARTRLSQAAVRAAVQSGLGLAGCGAAGLLLGDCLGQYGGVAGLAGAAWREDRRLLRRVSPRRLRWAARRFARFPLIAAPSAVLNVLGTSLPLLLLPAFFGPIEAGFYLIGQRLAGWPVTLIGQSVAQVFYADLASRPDDHVGNWRRFCRLSAGLATLGLLGSALLLTAPLWAGPLLGAQWKESGAVMAAMAPMLAGRLLVSPLSQVYFVRGRQDVLIGMDVLRLALTVGVLWLSWRGAWEFTPTILAFSLILLATYVLHWALIARLMRVVRLAPSPTS